MDDSDFAEDDDFGADDEFEWEEDGDDAAECLPDEVTVSPSRLPFECLDQDALREKKQELLTEAGDVTGLPQSEAEVLLRAFRWQLSDLTEMWFSDPDRVCNRVALTPGSDSLCGLARGSPGTCPACFEEIAGELLFSLPCCHRFCGDCWRGYLDAAVTDGPPSLHTKCPFPKCDEAVRATWFTHFCSPNPLEKYELYRVRDFVENNAPARWCPWPDCGNALIVRQLSVVDVECSCGWRFCMKCGQEAHRPITCTIVTDWIQKNADEAENMTWILANTKPCPKCKHPIEKNQGCMHMVCRCKHQFCWLCLADDYNYSHTRDGSPCNKFPNEPNAEQAAVRKNLVRYAHFFERYKSHEKAQQLAREKTLPQVLAGMEQLHRHIGDWKDIAFLEDATRQVVECRRILKWSYAYGYFSNFDEARQSYFEYQQGALEQRVDQLQELSEKTDLSTFFEPEAREKFTTFKSKLLNLTRVTRDFFQNLSKMFEEWQDELADESASVETEEAAPGVAPVPARPRGARRDKKGGWLKAGSGGRELKANPAVPKRR